jgi:hypothetical protein
VTVRRLLLAGRFVVYLPLRLALPLGGAATGRDIRRQLQPRLDLPLPASYTSAELVGVLAHRPFRSIFYKRLRGSGLTHRLLAGALSLFYKGEPALFISCDDIGPGLMLMHGFATIITAQKIGADCQVSQQVTIGYDDRGSPPILGDRVRIGANAVVLGATCPPVRLLVASRPRFSRVPLTASAPPSAPRDRHRHPVGVRHPVADQYSER